MNIIQKCYFKGIYVTVILRSRNIGTKMWGCIKEYETQTLRSETVSKAKDIKEDKYVYHYFKYSADLYRKKWARIFNTQDGTETEMSN